jgi:hypothetical protein
MTTTTEEQKIEAPPIEPIWGAIRQEVTRQGLRWGFEHDRQHTLYDWVAILTKRASGVFDAQGYSHQGKYRKARLALVQIAAVAVSAIRALDTNKQTSPAGAWCCSLCLPLDKRTPATHWSTDVDTGEPEPLCDGCKGAR